VKELIIRATCDGNGPGVLVCDGDGVQDVIVWGRTIDLCTAHRAQLVDPLRALVDACGVREDPPTDTGRPGGKNAKHANPCLCGKGPANHGHVTEHHGMNVSELFGNRCPLCGETFERASGAGTHASRAHGVNGLGAAFDQATREGDRFGVVAQRRQLISTPPGPSRAA